MEVEVRGVGGMASAASSLVAFMASATISSRRARDIAGYDFGFTSGRTTDERASPLVYQWATVFQGDSCNDENLGGSAGLAGGPRLT